MIVVEKNTGLKLPYEVVGTKLFLNDEIILNLAKYQRDWSVTMDVCLNQDDMLVIGAATGLYYAAQVYIPACEYEAVEEPVLYDEDHMGGSSKPAVKLPLDMNKVELTLWAIDKLKEVGIIEGDEEENNNAEL